MNDNIDDLIVLFLHRELSETKNDELNKWIGASDNNKALFERLTDQKWVSAELDSFRHYNEDTGWKKVMERLTSDVASTKKDIRNNKIKMQFLLKRIAVAASLLLLTGLGSYFLLSNRLQREINIVKTIQPVKDIQAPKGSKAMIILANGNKLYLDSLSNGALTYQGNVSVMKLTDGQVIYGSAIEMANKKMQYNTLTNPRGSAVVPITLSDGTKVWLNSASSLKYPVTFSKRDRKVELSGEAYFEVAHNKTKPFKVVTNNNSLDQEIKVLGTHFNVNSYTDESTTKTTLLEGSIKISNGNHFLADVLLAPGQQSVLQSNGLNVYAADIEEAVAWKNGYFQFNESDLSTIMRQLSRWYNIDVVFEGNKHPAEVFHFKASKNISLTKMLEMLELNDINFKIEGRTLIVKS
uniref:FecR family protein n=1 Tax=Pedobacter schmidteae TaxID=2201271 RepID=UPI0013CE551C|nr:FecR family protein [Pedobacter schmidteae]